MLPFANPRHEHEIACLARHAPASDVLVVAGVIDTTTNYVEHPEVVADRLERVATALGDATRVLAGTDCGFDTAAGLGGVASEIVWEKLAALRAGADLASRRLLQRMTASVRMVVAALVLRAALAQAQLPPAAPAPTTPPTTLPAVEETVPIAQIPDRAGQVDQELRTIRARLAGDELLAKLRPEIDAVDKQIAQVSSDFTRNVASGVTATGLNDIRSQWLQLRDLMTSWAGQLNVRAEAADRDLARLGELEGLWARTADATKGTDVGPAVLDTIAGARAGIRDLQAKARAEREDVLEALARLSGLKADVADRVEELDQVEARFRADLLTFESPPLWDVVGRVGSLAAARQQAHTGLVRTVRLAQAFAKTQRPRMILHGLLTTLLLTLVVRLSRRRTASGQQEHDDAMRAIVAHPIVATAVLVADADVRPLSRTCPAPSAASIAHRGRAAVGAAEPRRRGPQRSATPRT